MPITHSPVVRVDWQAQRLGEGLCLGQEIPQGAAWLEFLTHPLNPAGAGYPAICEVLQDNVHT